MTYSQNILRNSLGISGNLEMHSISK